MLRSHSVSYLSGKEFEAHSRKLRKHQTMLPEKLDSLCNNDNAKTEASLELQAARTGELIRKLMDNSYNKFSEGFDDPFDAFLWLSDNKRTGNPTVEVRRNASGNTVQLAMCTRSSEEREQIWGDLNDGTFSHTGLQLAKGGDSTIELAYPNVNKALALRWVNDNYLFLLDKMGYQPGDFDARKRNLVLFADADDTLYYKQETYPDDPLKANLAESPTRENLINYLKSGGILGVCTGNDLTRAATRLLAGIDKSLHQQVLPRIFISGNAGASMAYFKPSEYGEFEITDVPGYSTEACQILDQRVSDLQLDAIYVGDDQRPDGNDVPGFRYVGNGRAYCVSHSDLANPELAYHYQGGPEGASELLGEINKRIKGIIGSGSEVPIWPGQMV